MEKKELPQPLQLQPLTATAPPMPAGEGVPYYPPQDPEPYAVDHTTAAAAPPPYQVVDQTQQVMQGYSEPLLQQPTGYQAQGYPALTYPVYVQQPQSNIVVLTQPVAPPIVVQPEARSDTPIVGLVWAIVMIFVCLMCANVLALSCLIPALVVASMGVASNDNTKRTKLGNASLIINIVNLLFWIFIEGEELIKRRMEKKELPQPLALQPLTATAPPIPAGEGVPYYPPQEPYAVDHTTAAAAPPPYQAVDQTQQVMQGYSAPLLQQPTGYQAQGYIAPTYPQGYIAPSYPVTGYVQQPQGNIVVVTQQPVVPPVAEQPLVRSNTPMVGLVYTIIMMVLCLMIGNVLALSCLIPALVVACIGIASDDNIKRKKFGNASLLTGGLTLLVWALLIIAIPIITVIGFAIVPES